MAATLTEEDDENLRQQCENASLEDALHPAHKTTQKAILPPIKLGMSFSDWKQMKEAAEEKHATNSANERNHNTPQWQNQRNNMNKSFTNYLHNQNNNNQFLKPQQQNLPNFNEFAQRPNQRSARNFFQDTMIPPIMPLLMPPTLFDDFRPRDQQWSSGSLMQPMFPPMLRMPRLNQQGMRTNQLGQHNRLSSQKRPSARTRPKSGQTNSTATKNGNQKGQQSNNTKVGNTAEERTFPSEADRTHPQIYIQRPRNSVNKSDTPKSGWILKPQAPPPMLASTPEMREEKQRMWREYRQAMKPFKNREFANAKRIVQRLGKKNYKELEEKDRERLDRALEAVNAHKSMLSTRVVQRSARIEKQFKHEPTDSGHGFHPATSLRLNYKSDNPIWKSSSTHNATNPLRASTLTPSFISGGFWSPSSAVTQPRS